MKTYYRTISFLFALLVIITTNTSYYSRAKDAGYKMKDSVVRAARNNPKTAIGIGVTAGVGVLLLSSRVRGRMRDLKDWGKEWAKDKYTYGFSDRFATPGQKQARQARLEKEKEELRGSLSPAEISEIRSTTRRKIVSEKSQRFGPETQVSAKELEEIRKKREKKLKQSETDSDEEEAEEKLFVTND